MTLEEMESWLDSVGRPAQISYRVRYEPRWLVRIWISDCRAFIQTVDDDLEAALLRAIDIVENGEFIDEYNDKGDRCA